MASAKLHKHRWLGAGSVLLVLFLTASTSAQTQASTRETNDIRSLVLQLQLEVKQTRQDLAQAQRQIQRLSWEMEIFGAPKVSPTTQPQQPGMSNYLSPAD